MSQYELAAKLGWVRSKIKRLEKGEVASIDEEDLEAIEKELGISSSDNVIVLEPKKPRGARKIGLPFSVLQKEERAVAGTNQVFFLVRMKTTMRAEDLLTRNVKLLGYEGAIHGVENSRDQEPLKPGDEFVIMLWGRGIAERRGARSSSSA